MSSTKVHAIIGANFGDEGKGLMVDALTEHYIESGNSVWSIRHNGGAQAGHTVVRPDGLRHVFSHIPAGHMRGAYCYLGPQFISNPVLFRSECGILANMGKTVGRVYAHPAGRISTPWDMLVNQAIETFRQQSPKLLAHGSCGVGINETVVRAKRPLMSLKLRALEVLPTPVLRESIELIQRYYVPVRLNELGISYGTDLHKKVTEHALAEEFLLKFMDDLAFMKEKLDLRDPKKIFSSEMTYIFEGAQGLGLDALNAEYAPHLTPSRTGLHSIIEMLEFIPRVDTINAHYLTRSYVTRHGNGRLDDENKGLTYEDNTNATGEFQGRLRFAPLTPKGIKAMALRIGTDVSEAMVQNFDIKIEPSLVVTHLDQKKLNPEQLAKDIDVKLFATSNGPTHEHVTIQQTEESTESQEA